MNPEQHPSPEGKRLTSITILHTNDIHGNQKNLPALSAAIAEMLKENPKAILVDCGDIAYNYPYSESHHFEPMPEFLNANAYNTSSLGNHEFQWPPATLRQELLERLKPDVLCANILERETGQPIPGLKPYVIREIDGVKVAFIGIVTQDMATPAHPDVGDGLIKLNEDESLKKYAAEARKEGAEVIVALTHQGVGDDKKTADAVPGLDLIIGGHDHFVTDDPLVVGTYPHQTYIVEAGQSAKYLGETTLLFDTESREVLTASMKPIPTGRYFTRPEVAQKAA
jgi:2',3'-cyclic-nucleotide 2'-phosphodiesterase (5'-nucleotidase family)